MKKEKNIGSDFSSLLVYTNKDGKESARVEIKSDSDKVNVKKKFKRYESAANFCNKSWRKHWAIEAGYDARIASHNKRIAS